MHQTVFTFVGIFYIYMQLSITWNQIYLKFEQNIFWISNKIYFLGIYNDQIFTRAAN